MEHTYLGAIISDIVHWCPLVMSEAELNNIDGNLAQTVFHFMSMKENPQQVKKSFWLRHKDNIHKRVNRMRYNYSNSISQSFQCK